MTVVLVQETCVRLRLYTWQAAPLAGTRKRSHAPKTLLCHPRTAAPPLMLCLKPIGRGPNGTYAQTIGNLLSLTSPEPVKVVQQSRSAGMHAL